MNNCIKFIYIIIISLLIPSGLFASEDTIKVLMVKDRSTPLPSGQLETIDNLSGKVFFDGRFISGSIMVTRAENGIYVINQVSFTKYIEAEVSSETGKEWEPEAVKAQAVVTRTLATFYRMKNAYQPYQVLSNISDLFNEEREISPIVSYALSKTEGEILTYEDLPVRTLYNSACSDTPNMTTEIQKETYYYLKRDHKAGFCQTEAVEMAKKGITYREILSYFFPETVIQKSDNIQLHAKKTQK